MAMAVLEMLGAANARRQKRQRKEKIFSRNREKRNL
jgi:hypothetical protein